MYRVRLTIFTCPVDQRFQLPDHWMYLLRQSGFEFWSFLLLSIIFKCALCMVFFWFFFFYVGGEPNNAKRRVVRKIIHIYANLLWCHERMWFKCFTNWNLRKMQMQREVWLDSENPSHTHTGTVIHTCRRHWLLHTALNTHTHSKRHNSSLYI